MTSQRPPERGKPFVAYLPEAAVGGLRPAEWDHIAGSPHEQGRGLGNREWVPVVVTPLLPDDPKPGETWLLPSGDAAFILSPPYNGVVVIEAPTLRLGALGYDVARLTRPPVLKTYRVPVWLTNDGGGWSYVKAESKEAALAKLSEALEEIP